ncbi:MAG: OmpH family outer membrane protein [Bacteroidales bacterium]|nr:OmpH family outer membrane protein [Bacteroidales bacterium]
MKKLVVFLVILIGFSSVSFSQKTAFVDTKYILENIPDYQMAQDQLNELAKKWQKEIDDKITEIEKMYQKFQTDAVLLPADLKKKREDEIVAKERELKTLQKQRFGTDGDLYKKRAELVKPIQDKVYNAIEEYANDRGYAIIFDRAGSGTILYANSRFDVSDEILTKMGYTPATKSQPASGQQNTPQRKETPDEKE